MNRQWRNRWQGEPCPDYGPNSEYFSIRMLKVVMGSEVGYDSSIMGYIDYCSAATITLPEMLRMGIGLGLGADAEKFRYSHVSEDDGVKLIPLENEGDVLKMALSVDATNIVDVHAVLDMTVENEDGDDSDLQDSDYSSDHSMRIDGNMQREDNEEVVSLMENETVFEERNQGVNEGENQGDNQGGNEGENHDANHDANQGAKHGENEDLESDIAASNELYSCSDSDSEIDSAKPKFPEFDEENMEDPEFQIGMLFRSFEQFKEAVRNYGIKNRYVVKFRPNNKTRCKAYCKNKCPFYLWASHMNKDMTTVQIKSGTLEHQCTRDHNIRHVNPKWLGNKYIEQFRADPNWSLNGIIQAVRSNQKASIGKVTAYRAKQQALIKINGDEGEQIEMLNDYRLELIRTHPTSTIIFKREEGVFQGMYVCLAPLRDGFLDGCRKIISIDGCWLKGLYGGQLLAAVGIDANDCTYPFAWCVVDKETTNNWMWFLGLLADDLQINNSHGWAFMSDRQKGLIHAVDALFPHAEHRYCVRHILTNFRKRFKGKTLKDSLWACARATYEERFTKCLEAVGEINKGAHAYLSGIVPSHWTRSHFNDQFKCDMLLNNLCESFNHVILEARTKGIITMNEMIRTKLMVRIQKKRDAMLKLDDLYCPKILKKLEKARQLSWFYRAEWSGGDRYQVFGFDGQFVVDKGHMTCACRRWQLTGIPCHHAISAMNVNDDIPENYLDDCYRVSTYLKTYSHLLNPTNGRELWPKSDDPPIIPPKPVNFKRGRRQLLRKKEDDELERPVRSGIIDNKVTKKGQIKRCSECGSIGHNKRLHLKPNAPTFRPPHTVQLMPDGTTRRPNGNSPNFFVPDAGQFEAEASAPQNGSRTPHPEAPAPQNETLTAQNGSPIPQPKAPAREHEPRAHPISDQAISDLHVIDEILSQQSVSNVAHLLQDTTSCDEPVVRKMKKLTDIGVQSTQPSGSVNKFRSADVRKLKDKTEHVKKFKEKIEVVNNLKPRSESVRSQNPIGTPVVKIQLPRPTKLPVKRNLDAVHEALSAPISTFKRMAAEATCSSIKLHLPSRKPPLPINSAPFKAPASVTPQAKATSAVTTKKKKIWRPPGQFDPSQGSKP